MIRPFDFAVEKLFNWFEQPEEPKGAQTVSPKKRDNPSSSSAVSPIKAKQLRRAPPSQPVDIQKPNIPTRRKLALLDESSSSVDSRRLGTLTLDPFGALVEKIDNLSKQFHGFTASDITNIVIEIDCALSNEKRRGLQIITTTNAPCVVTFNHDEKTAYILATDKHPGMKPFSRLLGVSNAVKITWKNTTDSKKQAHSFEVEKVSQQTTLSSLSAENVKKFSPFEMRLKNYIDSQPDLLCLFPKAHDLLEYPLADGRKGSYITTWYPLSLQDDFAQDKLIYGDLLSSMLKLLKDLATLHSHDIIHGDICLHKLMVDDTGHPKLIGFEYAYKKDGNGPSWEKGYYGSQFELTPELKGAGDLFQIDLTKMDVYALGNVMQQLVAQIDMREGLNHQQENLTLDQRRMLKDRSLLQTLITRMQHPNFQQRFSAIDAHNFILNHTSA
ncbi:MAG: hypothetical protein LLF94_00985 [Chlamydiales bacterium]|nr:hypothetical protein [Chlamydiales bacterium]